MTAWWQNILRFTDEGGTIRVATSWFRETYVPQSVIDAGDRGLFLAVDSDLLGETTVRFAVGNGWAQYRVSETLPEVWDESHVYGYTRPVARLRLSKAGKSK